LSVVAVAVIVSVGLCRGRDCRRGREPSHVYDRGREREHRRDVPVSLSLSLGPYLDLDLFLYLDVSMNPAPD
jgi:hypothetical protein